jgi:hypothetical protein
MIELLRPHNLLSLGLLLTLIASGCGGGDGADGAGGAGAGSSGTTGSASTGGGTPSGERFFDHRHTDLAQIPASCIDAVKSADWVFHYTHRSHGAQIIHGAESLAASLAEYGFAAEYCGVPAETGVLRMWDGMTDNNLVEAEHYWASDAGLTELRGLLSANPELRYSMWAWSFEISEQTEQQVEQYLETLNALEAEFPEVTFIYMTGPAQETYNGVNRTDRNRQIRDFAMAGGKALYDFEDLDVWYNGAQHTQVVDGVEIPMEHPQYSLETPGNTEYEFTHTTQESCENKARAFWWMMAKLEGCDLP